MEKHRDIFGAVLCDEFERGGALDILERDDGYIDAVPVRPAYFSAFDEWSRSEQECVEYVSGRVLDIGCGAGRHSLYFQKEGFAVAAVDVSAGAVTVARGRGVADARVLAIENVDSLGAGFCDTVLLLGNNFGLVQSRERCAVILEKLAYITGPSGRIIAQSMAVGKTVLPEHLSYQRHNIEAGRLPGQITLRHRYKNYTENWWEYLFVSPDEMRALLISSPWEIQETIPEPNSPSYIAVLRKRR